MAQQETIEVRLLFFGAARDVVGSAEATLKLNAPVRASEAFEELLKKYPELRRFGRSLLFALNQEYTSADMQIEDGDELAIFPPVSGGSGSKNHGGANDPASVADQTSATALELSARSHDEQDFFELTDQSIDVGQVARRVVPPHCGATVTLDGYAREWTHGRRTVQLVYEAYAPMALKEMERLGAEVHKRFEIAHIGIVHRTGRLEIGETSVVISVSAPHRAAAFAACEWAITELKRTVPIWKKEIFDDGETWVEGEQRSPFV